MSLPTNAMRDRIPNTTTNNASILFMRKAAHPFGFQQVYNFTFFIIFAGALLGFTLDRVPYLALSKGLTSGIAPSEAFWYSQRYFRIGIVLHLVCIFPSSVLAIVQFVPIITDKALIFHRVNGHVVNLLLFLANVGALMIARHSFGGSLASQSAVGTLVVATTGAAVLAYYYVKRLQIHLHRDWMLRCWFYAGSIITMRIINAISAHIISRIGSYSTVIRCDEIAFILNQTLAHAYPACVADPVSGLAVVHANMLTPTSAVEAGAAASVGFGMALWMAMTIHAVGIEIYLALTPAETERLRAQYSQRRLERGLADEHHATGPSQIVTAKDIDERNASQESDSSVGIEMAKIRSREDYVDEVSLSNSPVEGRGFRWY